MESSRSPLYRLVDIMARLRGPGGCPWDLKQNHQTLKPYLIEEAYEVLDAIEEGDDTKFCEELGDLMLQVVFHAQLAQEEGRFTVDDVATAICEKLVRRHPHVFGDVEAKDAETVLKNWEHIKMAERKEKEEESRPASVLDGVPNVLPGLLKAQRIQEKAARVGFDWQQAEDVVAKVEEEMEELRQSLHGGSKAEMAHELGDLLFSVVNLARKLDIDSEQALTATNRRFIERFQHMERQAAGLGKDLTAYTLEELDALWEQAKHILAKQDEPEIGEGPQVFS